MSVLTVKLQEENLQEDLHFLKQKKHLDLASGWSEFVAHNFSCQDTGSSGMWYHKCPVCSTLF